MLIKLTHTCICSSGRLANITFKVIVNNCFWTLSGSDISFRWSKPLSPPTDAAPIKNKLAGYLYSFNTDEKV